MLKYFINGLNYEEKQVIINSGFNTIREMVTMLKNIENLKMLCTTNNKTTEFIKHNIIQDKNYCKLHGNSNHSTKQCWKLNNKKMNHLTNEVRQHKTNSITQENENLNKKELIYDVKINNEKFKVLFDSGSKFNIISKNIFKKLKLNKKKIKPIFLNTASNEKIVVNYETELFLTFEENSNDLYKLNALISDQITSEFIILGTEFFYNNKVKLDFDNKQIIFEDFSFPINKDTTITDSNNNPRICTIPKNFNEKILELVSKQKENNPQLGTISGFEHEINLKE
ncbi:hypothetical protein H311_03926, partial [Anncaliia algerae PRA109]